MAPFSFIFNPKGEKNMSKANIASFLRGVQRSTVKHSPEILTGLGIVGMAATVVMAVRATPKALRLVEEERAEQRVEKLEPIEVVKVSWKCYIPAAVTGVVSVACIVGASSVNMRRNAALVAAYKLSETALADYKEKVTEAVGEKKERTIREKVAQKHIEKTPIETKEVIITEKGNTLFLEPLSKRYFKSDLEKVRKAANDLNDEIFNGFGGVVTLNDFYTEIGLETTDMGDQFVWNTDNRINLHIVPGISKDDEPCLVIEHHNPPKYDY